MAVTLYGVGRAVSKDPEMFHAIREKSARFRRSLQMVTAALDCTDIDVLRAYVNTLNPAMWLNGAARSRRPARIRALRELAQLTGRLDRYDRLARLTRQGFNRISCGCLKKSSRSKRRRDNGWIYFCMEFESRLFRESRC